MEPTIPRVNSDISETVRKKYRRTAIICLLWAVIISFAELLFMYEYFVSRLNVLSSCIIWIALAIIPFFAMGVPKMLTDKSWCGEIIEIDHKIGKSINPGRKVAYLHTTHCTTHLVVKTGDKISVHHFPKKKLQFKAGDVICHFRGTNYPVYAVRPLDGTQICPICGVRIAPDKRRCPLCDHSVIKSKLI